VTILIYSFQHKFVTAHFHASVNSSSIICSCLES
jgi:hypothetical protein